MKGPDTCYRFFCVNPPKTPAQPAETLDSGETHLARNRIGRNQLSPPLFASSSAMSHKSRFPQVPQENCSIPGSNPIRNPLQINKLMMNLFLHMYTGRINCYEKSATNTNSHTAPSVSSDAHLLRDADAGMSYLLAFIRSPNAIFLTYYWSIHCFNQL
ncbi:hypothetical protein PtA15_12A533 [Puccinia triticina]|uniref:Uncharacterized protein n=1 Tax=Puccinia triticina TaxID=208348 RepID=A0ABY7D060_9BASI|nr:uncharacterized protein PtA15_12A533 [Puccinia triticina]WAQ90543.1 hypothetical protein PtA15_12A533 [Puccinia triticina]WAR61858.1 hypothetical protein PtB15_12B550 [Puccinia triticina]